MTITKKMQLDWLRNHAKELEQNQEAKGCDLVPCEECPFYIGDTSMDHNCILDLISHRDCNKIVCDHLCIRYMEKECITQRDDGNCDQPDMYREYADVIDAAKEAAEDAKMST